MLETYLDLLELDYFEIGEAFKGLADENVWKRPADGLLSVGELAAHICYGEATRLGGDGVKSPLIDSRFAYYPKTLAVLPSEELLAMTASDVFAELMRVHTESVAIYRASNPDLDSFIVGNDGWTHKENLKYMIFHVAYHTGQIYSALHLLGAETVDN